MTKSNRADLDSEWQRKGATLSDKTARKELGLTQDEIVRAVRAGELQCRCIAEHAPRASIVHLDQREQRDLLVGPRVGGLVRRGGRIDRSDDANRDHVAGCVRVTNSLRWNRKRHRARRQSAGSMRGSHRRGAGDWSRDCRASGE